MIAGIAIGLPIGTVIGFFMCAWLSAGRQADRQQTSFLRGVALGRDIERSNVAEPAEIAD